jgi:hypothetical protein
MYLNLHYLFKSAPLKVLDQHHVFESAFFIRISTIESIRSAPSNNKSIESAPCNKKVLNLHHVFESAPLKVLDQHIVIIKELNLHHVFKSALFIQISTIESIRSAPNISII